MAKQSARPLTSGGRSLSIKRMEKDNKGGGSGNRKGRRPVRSENGGETFPVEDAARRIKAREQDSETVLRKKLADAKQRLSDLEKQADEMKAAHDEKEQANELASKTKGGYVRLPWDMPSSMVSQMSDVKDDISKLAERVAPFDSWTE